MTRVTLLLMLSLLTACSFEVQPEPQGAWNEWVCDSQIKVYWRPDAAGGQSVQLRVGAGNMLHILQRMPSNSGELYADSQLAFELQGDQAQVYTINGHTIVGRNCRAQTE